MSLLTGFTFSWLSRGNYLENRIAMKHFLTQENLLHQKIYYYNDKKDENFSSVQLAELISTVNPRIYFTENEKDTLKKEVLTKFKIESKLKLKKNRFQ